MNFHRKSFRELLQIFIVRLYYAKIKNLENRICAFPEGNLATIYLIRVDVTYGIRAVKSDDDERPTRDY